MTIHQMQIFREIVETQSFSQAGKKLYLSQPSVSAQLKSFEKALGLVLIDRQQSNLTNGIVLTEDGHFVLEVTRRILSEWERVLNYSKNMKQKNSVIKLITNSPVGSYLLPELLSNFSLINPSVKIKLLLETNYSNITRLVKSKSYDLCIAPALENILNDINIIHSFKIPIVFVTANHSFPVVNQLSLEELNDLNLILPPANSLIREVINRFFAESSVQLKGIMEVEHSEAIKRILLANEKCFAILSSISINDELKNGTLRVIQTDPPLPDTEYIVFNQKGKPLQPDVNLFVNYLRDSLPKVI